MTFSYARAGDGTPSKVVAPQDGQLTPEELSDLLDIALRTDQWAAGKGRAPRRKELAQLCREAYCYAVGLQQVVDGAAPRPLPETVEQLVRLLRNQPRQVLASKPPALVVACDYLVGRATFRLKALKGCNSQTLAAELGISGSAITRAEALLTLPPEIQAQLPPDVRAAIPGAR